MSCTIAHIIFSLILSRKWFAVMNFLKWKFALRRWIVNDACHASMLWHCKIQCYSSIIENLLVALTYFTDKSVLKLSKFFSPFQLGKVWSSLLHLHLHLQPIAGSYQMDYDIDCLISVITKFIKVIPTLELSLEEKNRPVYNVLSTLSRFQLFIVKK